jgi:hypothetical protein
MGIFMIKPGNTYQKRKYSAFLLLGAVSAFIMAVLGILFWLITEKNLGLQDGQGTFFAFLVLLGFILWVPSMYLAAKRNFDLFHPLVFPVWTYLFPSLVLGGFMIPGLGLYPSWILTLIPDPGYYLPLAAIYIILGFAGLVAGFVLPFGGRMGRGLSRHVPAWRWDPDKLLKPAILMILIGVMAYVMSHVLGVVGYQMSDSPSLFGGLAFSLSAVGDFGAFLLWWAYWGWQRNSGQRLKKSYMLSWALAFLLWGGRLVTIVLISGSRASFLVAMLQVVAAYYLVRRKFSKRALMGFGLIIVIALLAGLLWGTTYREIKESESLVSLEEGLQVASDALTQVGNRGIADNAAYAFEAFLTRIDTFSCFAVIVSNYQSLKFAEKQLGIAGNMWTYTWTSFIPRFLWPEKPLISDARTIAEIYFRFPKSSFAFTLFGDLLRNFGPFGIPIGMALLGIFLRLLYTVGVEEGHNSAWRSAVYFTLLIGVPYESFYSTILPIWIRMAFMLLLGGAVVNFLVRLQQHGQRFFSLYSEYDTSRRRINSAK